MEPVQIVATVVSIGIALVGITLFVRAIRHIIAVVKLGQPINRTNQPGSRTTNMLKETLGHTRMLQWTWVGAGHWFVFVGFGLLFFTLVTAFGQLFNPQFALPFIGHWWPWEWLTEFVTLAMLVAIIAFIGYRSTRPDQRVRGVQGRFFGSIMWQGFFVEFVILGVGLCIALLRGAEYAILQYGDHSGNATALHFPLTFWLGNLMEPMSEASLSNVIWTVAMIKILISFIWMITIAVNPDMGVAWHRFLVFFNVFFKRKADGGTALGALSPIMVGDKPFNLEMIDEIDEDTQMGVGRLEDFAWKGILDFSTCTECGRCQSQCPAWNTDKPLSPKLLVMGLREHAYNKAPYLLAAEDARQSLPEQVRAEADRELVGATEGDAWWPSGGAVIDPDVLWSCTSCGACVQQCPVDIEHVDHIIDMRRYQVLIESNFPSELNGLFKGLENKGNPWNMNANARMDWASNLDFDVKVVGEDVESLDEVEWLFWVGCAGAYEDRAKKTTAAVAELLNLAGVDFAVLGNGETCTGDPARRSGNEFVFQQLAMENAEMFKETKVKKVVSTCAHCFNTLKNEYQEFGLELEVVHHTQLLNRLVREGRLTPVPDTSAPQRTVTYHDPCYLGRHNQVYSPPRELLQVVPGAQVKEMERNSQRSFCCGAGGARMWMEEQIGERININRTKEAVGTGADQIAVGCPFCRVMLSDGLTKMQADGDAREEVEVLDVAQLLLAGVKRGEASAVEAAPAQEPEPTAEETAEPESAAAEPASPEPATDPAAATAPTQPEPAQDPEPTADETAEPIATADTAAPEPATVEPATDPAAATAPTEPNETDEPDPAIEPVGASDPQSPEEQGKLF